MQSAVLFSGIPGPDRKVACLGYPTSGISMEAKTADYIRPALAATIVAQKTGDFRSARHCGAQVRRDFFCRQRSL